MAVARASEAAAAAGRWSTAAEVQRELATQADPSRVAGLARFFKTGPGEYAQGDRFRGLRVPQVRAIVGCCDGLPPPELARLVASPWHEDRLAGLLVAVRRFRRSREESVRRALYLFYLESARAGRINNWDLVDVTAEHIVGGWLRGRPERERVLDGLARSSQLWERRIAVLATFHFIRCGEFGEMLRLAALLRDDPHDLMHKAVGWMLREIGKRDRTMLDGFLATHAARMPRTMLRYAIEKHGATERAWWSARCLNTVPGTKKNPPERGSRRVEGICVDQCRMCIGSEESDCSSSV